MAATSTLFRGLTFFLAGKFSEKPLEDIEALLRSNCASLATSVKDSAARLNFVLSTVETAHILDNPYKLQFLPEIKEQIEFAQMHKIPIVDFAFIEESLKQNKLLPATQFIIPEFVVDVEAKFRLSHDVASDLDPRVQNLIKDLFDQSKIDRSLVDMGLDVRKMKLVTPDSIRSAYQILGKLESQLAPLPGQTKAAHEAELKQISNQFYNLIPHASSDNPALNSPDALKDKAALLGALTDIEIAQRLMQSSGGDDTLNMNPIDVNYRKLRANIFPLEAYRAEYSLISQMLSNTQSEDFKFRVELLEVFEVDREGEEARFEPFRHLPHHRLLWHGSRTPNYIGILSQGLRIAPPEAPVTGYFLGKGIYLADMVSVSSQYCRVKATDPEANQFGYLLLCDAALGRQYQIAHGKFISKEDLDENGFHSVKCWGTKGPRAGYDVTTPDGLIASLGKEGPTAVPVSELLHNEIVVYDPAQVRMKYLIKVRFTWPGDASAGSN